MDDEHGDDDGQEVHGADPTSQGGGSDAEFTHSDTWRRGQPWASSSLPVEHLCHQSSVAFGEDLLRNSHDTVNENIFADWCWGTRPRAGKRRAQEGSSVPRGSDSGFGSPRGSPRGSLASTSSDEVDAGHELATLGFGMGLGFGFGSRNQAAWRGRHGVSSSTAWPVLRTRTRTGSVDPDVASTCRALSLQYLGAAMDMHDRKPLATMVGPRREKLTEQQKRRNHILHEKKRRALIKDGFNDLLDMVPDVKDRGLSKSAILFKTADWLGSLVCENEALRARARALDGSGRGSGSGSGTAGHQP
ncbi:Helix-loop-helix DNA-binding protein [Metarhizium album ARSEF 1941]|uniref:Helix-loop-helix DNA-binding protein n=1 Tax=Metarhizium album (strain ARSEF 1941) TaxID=1081103 RepID=A0A0B2WUG1_METAS|nr:Helix-loop-helix DNA-binding protein [Metarhizium album ARSEF 1941]KHN97127.1 Helix-loop-helix DNA-binding protein [Metarhizium album ARSEF 1941]